MSKLICCDTSEPYEVGKVLMLDIEEAYEINDAMPEAEAQFRDHAAMMKENVRLGISRN